MGLIHTEAKSSTFRRSPPHNSDYTDYYANWCIFGPPGRGLEKNNYKLNPISHEIFDHDIFMRAKAAIKFNNKIEIC